MEEIEKHFENLHRSIYIIKKSSSIRSLFVSTLLNEKIITVEKLFEMIMNLSKNKENNHNIPVTINAIIFYSDILFTYLSDEHIFTIRDFYLGKIKNYQKLLSPNNLLIENFSYRGIDINALVEENKQQESIVYPKIEDINLDMEIESLVNPELHRWILENRKKDHSTQELLELIIHCCKYHHDMIEIYQKKCNSNIMCYLLLFTQYHHPINFSTLQISQEITLLIVISYRYHNRHLHVIEKNHEYMNQNILKLMGLNFKKYFEKYDVLDKFLKFIESIMIIRNYNIYCTILEETKMFVDILSIEFDI